MTYKTFLLVITVIFCISAHAQFRPKDFYWTRDGSGYLKLKEGGIVRTDLKSKAETIVASREQLTPSGEKPLSFRIFIMSPDQNKIMLFTNTAKVWRYNTRGNYWVYDISAGKLKQVGKDRPGQSLMFAKFSPDNNKVAYVSEHNIYVEDLTSGKTIQLTKDGTRKLINGTFDWVYEEELGCRDGFRWNPDSRSIAFWQVDATQVRDYYMLNTTDSVYSRVIPVEYPKVGEAPSPVKIGVVDITTGRTQWMNIPGDPSQNYLPRMEWTPDGKEIVVQQLNRKQQISKLFYCKPDGTAKNFYLEHDDAWIDTKAVWNDDDPIGWEWLNKGSDFLWVSEKDGWRHIYKVSRDGSKETLLTKGDFDVSGIEGIDEANQYVYFGASPDNGTELYLYRAKMDGSGKAELLSSKDLKGTHEYEIGPNAKFAVHTFSNYKTYPAKEWISLPDNKALDENKTIAKTMRVNDRMQVEYFKITTEDNITLDGWMIKPANFDSTKKYPVVFTVYTEPWSSTVANTYGTHYNYLFDGDLSEDGYFFASLDNRGTPSLRGRAWRKSVYRNLGRINIRDQAMAAKKFLDKPYFDKDRVAVYGWSGGGSATLNLMFQYPDIYKTGIAVAAVTNQLNYDNIYQEKYMGLPQENMDDFIKGSPITYAKNLRGNLLYIHGTGDDNVHYSNAEQLLNELIKNNKIFQFMPYPNRTHNINEGAGTTKHLSNLYTTFLRKNCPPGGR